MAKVEKKICYREVPNGARIETLSDGRMYALWFRNGKQETAEYVVTANGPRIKRESEVYIAFYRDAFGRQRERSTKCRDKRAAENKLNLWLQEVEKVKGGILSPEESEVAGNCNSRIEEILPQFTEFLKPRCKGMRYIKGILAYIRRVCKECKFIRMREMNSKVLIRWLNDQTSAGMGARTRNVHRIAMIRFANWAVDFNRIAYNPFLRVPKIKEKLDQRHTRRALSVEEISKLLKAAETRPLHELTLVRRGKNTGKNEAKIRDETKANAIRLGWERKLIYATLIYTGLRKSELKSITCKQVILDTEIPHFVLLNKDSKNGDGGLLPIHPALLPHLRDWIASEQQEGRMKQEDKLFRICDSLYHVMARDLKFAGIDKKDHLGRVIDVHALRHTHTTVLHETCVSLDVARDSMRHSSIEMTLNYTHKTLPSIAKGIYNLPDIFEKAENIEQKQEGETNNV